MAATRMKLEGKVSEPGAREMVGAVPRQIFVPISENLSRN